MAWVGDHPDHIQSVSDQAIFYLIVLPKNNLRLSHHNEESTQRSSEPVQVPLRVAYITAHLPSHSSTTAAVARVGEKVINMNKGKRIWYLR